MEKKKISLIIHENSRNKYCRDTISLKKDNYYLCIESYSFDWLMPCVIMSMIRYSIKPSL